MSEVIKDTEEYQEELSKLMKKVLNDETKNEVEV